MSDRIAVLMGGMSAEREVSLVSGRECAKALRNLGFDVIEIDANHGVARQLEDAAPDLVFNVLHGEWGEDGRVQGILDHFDRPYTHSGVLASALAMDKHKAKSVFREAGIDVPVGKLVTRQDILANGLPLATPCVVKPPAQGSSVGVFIIRNGDNRLHTALSDPNWGLGEELLVEEFIPGLELTTAVMGNRALGVTEIKSKSDFYDYESKYVAGGSEHELPAKVPGHIEAACLDLAVRAHQCLDCAGLTRSDFRYDVQSDRLCLLEINTIPGMTPTSLAPEQAAHVGISFDDLIAWMVEDARDRHTLSSQARRTREAV